MPPNRWARLRRLALRLSVCAALALLIGGWPGRAEAGFWRARCRPASFTGSCSPCCATITFQQTDCDLVVTLTNTSPSDVLDPGDVLTGVSFEVKGNPTLGLRSVERPTGHATWFAWPDLPGPLSSWAYSAPGGGLGGGGAGQGVSTPGAFGLTSLGDLPTTGTPAVTGLTPLVRNSLTFALPGLPPGFDIDDGISNVVVHYGDGSSASAEEILENPEPASLVLFALGAGGVVLYRRCRRRGPVP